MKHIKKLLIAMAIGMGLAGSAHAGIPADALTVTIRPNAYYAVTITTMNVALDLGTVALSASTQTVVPATVTIQSTYATTDLTLEGVITSPGSGDWTFDTSSASINSGELAAWATFTSVSRTTAPAQGGEFFAGTGLADNSDMITNAPRYVGSGGGANNLYEVASGSGVQEMDAMVPNTQSHLWLYFRLPSATEDNDPQSVTIILTAVQPN